MKNFILMVQFLTRIPINVNLDVKEEDFRKGVIYFPLVGLIVGLINALTYVVIARLLSSTLAVVAVSLMNILITGAFHLDGIADTCDGIFSARKKDRMLEIMKDSQIGTNGAVAIFFDLALRIVMLYTINEAHVVKAIIVSSIIARTITVVLMRYSVYARPDGGLGNLFIGKISRWNVIITLVIGSLLSTLIFGYEVLIILAVTVLFGMLFKNYITSKINGMTGDTLGASNELCEILVLLLVIIIERITIL